MTPILADIADFLLAHRRVCQTHARAGAIAVIGALARNFRTFDGDAVGLSVALVNVGSNISGEPTLAAVRSLLQAVGVPMPPLGSKGKMLERFKLKHPNDYVIVNPYAPEPATDIHAMLWFHSTRFTETGDLRDEAVPPPPELVAACRQLYDAPGGCIGFNAVCGSPDTKEDTIRVRLATLLALGDGRTEVGVLDELAAMEMILANLSVEEVLH